MNIEGPSASNTTKNSTKTTPLEKKKNENCGGRGKKRKILSHRAFGGSTLRGGPHLVVPESTSKNWPKSKLAEVEIGRSRSSSSEVGSRRCSLEHPKSISLPDEHVGPDPSTATLQCTSAAAQHPRPHKLLDDH